MLIHKNYPDKQKYCFRLILIVFINMFSLYESNTSQKLRATVESYLRSPLNINFISIMSPMTAAARAASFCLCFSAFYGADFT